METVTRLPDGKALVRVRDTTQPDRVAAMVVGPMTAGEADRWESLIKLAPELVTALEALVEYVGLTQWAAGDAYDNAVALLERLKSTPTA